jgi:hypothetical protein
VENSKDLIRIISSYQVYEGYIDDKGPNGCYNQFLNFAKKNRFDSYMVFNFDFLSVIYFFRSLIECITKCYPSFSRKPHELILNYMTAILKSNYGDDLISYFKYVKDLLFALCIKQEVLPPRPMFLPDVKGQSIMAILKKTFIFKDFCKFLWSRLVSTSKINIIFFNTIKEGLKKACFEVPQSLVYRSYLDHSKLLAKEPVVDLEFEQTFKEYLDRLITVQDFRRITPSLLEGSTSGSKQFKRSEGGQKEFVRSLLENDLNTETILQDNNFLDMVSNLSVYGSIMPSFKEVQNHTIDHLKNEGNNLVLTSIPSGNLDPDDLVLTWYTSVDVVAIKEPLKIRMISKGDSMTYYLSQFFQKAMWAFLQKFPQFSLTGKSLDTHPELLKIIMSPLPNFVSGDYKAATDNLNIRFTKLVFEKFLSLSGIKDDSLLAILRSVIYETHLTYPVLNHHEDIPDAKQKNGQLMGSTLSFPILCIVNLICFWITYEFHYGPTKPRDLPVLVNGDDILFKSDSLFYKHWKENIDKVGFKLSLGKNFSSPDFFTINSKLYDKNFNEIPYVNIGLLIGTSKSSGGRSKEMSPIWDEYNRLVNLIPESLLPFIHRRFIHYHREIISQLTDKGKYNLFLPKWLGGLGLRPVVPYKITPYQQYFSSYLYKYYGKQVQTGKFKSFNISLVKAQQNHITTLKSYHTPTLEFSHDPTRISLREYESKHTKFFCMADKTIPIDKEILKMMRNNEMIDTYGTVWTVKIPTKKDFPEFFSSIRDKCSLADLSILPKKILTNYIDPVVVIKPSIFNEQVKEVPEKVDHQILKKKAKILLEDSSSFFDLTNKSYDGLFA